MNDNLTREGAGLLPLALVVDDDGISRDHAAAVLRAAQWRVATADGGAAAVAAALALPSLIVMDLHMPGMSGWAATAAIRQLTGPAAAVPILAHTSVRLLDPATLREAGFDDYLVKPCAPADLVAVAATWRPDGAAATLDRLERQFGSAEIDPMMNRLRTLLLEAVAALDAGDATAIAHRVAGAAGTFGFGEVGRAWLALSEGEGDGAEEARRRTRRAIATIDARYHQRHGHEPAGGNVPSGSCPASRRPSPDTA